MKQIKTEHPTSEQLRAFGVGRLPPDEQAWVEQHVDSCDDCVQSLLALPDDTLLAKLKNCDTSVPETLASEHCSDSKPEFESEIPDELKNHPRYEILGRLGKGGMGVVYKAEHRVMRRTVALKVINQKLVRHQTAIERFRLEVRAAAKLSHPNIVIAHDAEQEGDLHYLVMEFVDGSDVAAQVKKAGPLPIRHACHFARQTALGLQHAHETGMVHRDIKPQNLMIARDGRVKILDFGLARLASEADIDPDAAKLTKDGVMLGTPDYMAPEQIIDCRTADIRADIYSLGCTLHYMLAGEVPFPTGSVVDKMQAQLKQQPSSLLELRNEVPTELVAILQKMMAKDVDERYQTPAEVAADLRPFCQAKPPSPTPVAPTPATPIQLEAAPEPDPLDLPADLIAPLPVASHPRKQSRRQDNFPKRALIVGGTVAMMLLGLLLIWGGVQTFGTGGAADPVATDDPGESPVVAEDESGKTGSVPIPVVESNHRILVVVPYRNFWGPDYHNVRKSLEDAGFSSIDVASSHSGQATATTKDRSGGDDPAHVDLLLSHANVDDYSAVIFTGAWPRQNLEFAENATHAGVAQRVIKEMLEKNKIVTAICGGTAVLANSGVLDRGSAASNENHPDNIKKMRSIEWRDSPTVVSGNIITAGQDEDAGALVNELGGALRKR